MIEARPIRGFLCQLIYYANQPIITASEGISVWKAKTSSTGSSTTIAESAVVKAKASTQSSAMGPGRSFRNFRFDTGPIFQAMETSFLS